MAHPETDGSTAPHAANATHLATGASPTRDYSNSVEHEQIHPLFRQSGHTVRGSPHVRRPGGLPVRMTHLFERTCGVGRTMMSWQGYRSQTVVVTIGTHP